MSVWIAVAALGAAGALARFAVSSALPSPFGTLAVNLTGAFVLGVLTGASVTGDALLLAGTGLLGSFTTFSTWMVESSQLGARAMALNLGGSLAGGLLAAGLGWLLGGAL